MGVTSGVISLQGLSAVCHCPEEESNGGTEKDPFCREPSISKSVLALI